MRAISAGDVDPAHFDAVGDDWDIEARAEASLAEAGLAPEFLDRRVGELSGGEAVLVAIAGIRLRRAPITLLDEPTNNLDRDARAKLAAMVRAWKGTLIVVSHDLSLLELMDDTAELYAQTLSVFGGPYSEWRAWLDAEQDAAKQAEVTAAQALRKEKRQRIEAEVKLAHRARTAKKAEIEKRVPKIIAHGRKMAAEVSAGRLRTEVGAKEEARAHRTRGGRAPRALGLLDEDRAARSAGVPEPPDRDDRRRGAGLGDPGSGACGPDRPERRRQDDAVGAVGRGRCSQLRRNSTPCAESDGSA